MDTWTFKSLDSCSCTVSTGFEGVECVGVECAVVW